MIQHDFVRTVATADGEFYEIDLATAAVQFPKLATAPYSITVMAEALLRTGGTDAAEKVAALLDRKGEAEFRPARVLMQDYAGLPALLDVAILRDMVGEAGHDPESVQLACPVDLIVDHSIITNAVGEGADARNLADEYADNRERFAFLRWAEQSFPGLRVVPPGNGIVHQINLEQISQPVQQRNGWLYPDTLIGTDSHSTMAGGLGIVGWGVGGIEATATLLGLPVTIAPPVTVGIHLTGAPAAGVLATDIALQLTRYLRERGVVGQLLEFVGPGAAALSVQDRATIANMAPEYGASCALFPFDVRTLAYLRDTGRSGAAQRLQAYLARQPLLDATREREYDIVYTFDLSTVTVTVAGPSLPHQARSLAEVATLIPVAASQGDVLRDGDIVLAAITSCTNTSNPEAILTAALLAQRADALGLKVDARIKTSFSPGSRSVSAYLARLDLLAPLARLGFAVAGFGCMTCVGNAGELHPGVGEAITAGDLNVAAVLSGNRNFQARIHPLIKSNFLMSPPLVVAYALAGTTSIDLDTTPLAHGEDGPVYLRDVWPAQSEVAQLMDQLADHPADVPAADAGPWQALSFVPGARFSWDADSTYFARSADTAGAGPMGQVLHEARPLLWLGDAITTDHISPVGRIAADSPAGQYLANAGVAVKDFNTYGARRGNPEVMRRGTFANPRLQNQLLDKAGWWTALLPQGDIMSIDAAAAHYRGARQETVIVAGQNYGIGSARDWAAKGTFALGVKAVLAQSFERIHRANLALVGVLPLQYEQLTEFGSDITFSIAVSPEAVRPGAMLPLQVHTAGKVHTVEVRCRLDTEFEIACWRSGGLLAYAQRAALQEA